MAMQVKPLFFIIVLGLVVPLISRGQQVVSFEERRFRDREHELWKRQYQIPASNYNTNPGIKTTNPASTVKPDVPSAESLKAYDDAKKRFDELAKITSCTPNTSPKPYQEISFLYTTKVWINQLLTGKKSLTKTQEMYQWAEDLNAISVKTGHFLPRTHLTAVADYENGRIVWTAYSVSCSGNYEGGPSTLFSFKIPIEPKSFVNQVEALKYFETEYLIAEENNRKKLNKEFEDHKQRLEENKKLEIAFVKAIKEMSPYKEITFTQDGWLHPAAKLEFNKTRSPYDTRKVMYVAVEDARSPGYISVYNIIFEDGASDDKYQMRTEYSFQLTIPNEQADADLISLTKYKRIEIQLQYHLKLIDIFTKNYLVEEEIAAHKKRIKERNETNINKIVSKGMLNNNEYQLDTRKFLDHQKTGVFIKDKAYYVVEDGNDGFISIVFDNSKDKPDFLAIEKDGVPLKGGQRIYFYENGDVFFEYRKKDRDGNTGGMKFFANGELYYGKFSNSLYTGFGQLLTAGGKYYMGEFNEGKIKKNTSNRESGKIKLGAGGIYRGAISNNKPEGWGMLKCTNGDVLHGDFILSKTFEGIIRTNDGRIIDGTFNLPVNFSETEKLLAQKDNSSYIIRYPNGDIFKGGLNDSLARTGRGTCYYKTGDVYIGNYSNDLRNDPEGLLIYKKGANAPNIRDICQVPFVKDKIDGKGVYFDAVKKEKYIGNFKEGVRDGEGTLYLADGTTKKVMYKDGVLQQ